MIHGHIDGSEGHAFTICDSFGVQAVCQVEENASVATALELAEEVVHEAVDVGFVVRPVVREGGIPVGIFDTNGLESLFLGHRVENDIVGDSPGPSVEGALVGIEGAA